MSFFMFFALSCKSRVIFRRKTPFDVFLRYAQEVQVNQTLPIGIGNPEQMDHPKDHSILLFWSCTSRVWIYIYLYRSFLFFLGIQFGLYYCHMCFVDEIPIDFGGMIFTEAMATTS